MYKLPLQPPSPLTTENGLQYFATSLPHREFSTLKSAGLIGQLGRPLRSSLLLMEGHKSPTKSHAEALVGGPGTVGTQLWSPFLRRHSVRSSPKPPRFHTQTRSFIFYLDSCIARLTIWRGGVCTELCWFCYTWRCVFHHMFDFCRVEFGTLASRKRD